MKKNNNMKNRIFTFAIGSNNNSSDWDEFIESNINKAVISNPNSKKVQTINNDNLNSFKQCLSYVDEGLLNNYYLTFMSYSYKRGGLGIASINYSKGNKLRGCIYELTSDDKITKQNIINLIRWKEY